MKRKVRIADISAKSVTQPNLGQTVAQVIERLQRGQSVSQSMPLYFGEKLPELIGFENMSKLEQIEFARKFRDFAKDNYVKESQEAEQAFNAKQAELNALANA